MLKYPKILLKRYKKKSKNDSMVTRDAKFGNILVFPKTFIGRYIEIINGILKK